MRGGRGERGRKERGRGERERGGGRGRGERERGEREGERERREREREREACREGGMRWMKIYAGEEKNEDQIIEHAGEKERERVTEIERKR